MTELKIDETKRNAQSIEQQSEEIQTIIERMPIKFGTFVAITVLVLILTTVLLAFTIKYPDTVDGKITITAKSAPIRIVANSNGKLYLIAKNNQTVKSGMSIAYIESGCNFRDVCYLDSILNNTNQISDIPFNKRKLVLGELSQFYNNFLIIKEQYKRTISSDISATMRRSLNQQIQIDREVIQNEDAEIELNRKSLSIQAKQLYKDSILFYRKAISEKDYNSSKTHYFDLQQNIQSLLTNKSSVLSRISQNTMDIRKQELDENENCLKVQTELSAKTNDLINNIKLWKEKYLIKSPANGTVQYLGFWRENIFIQSTQELFTVIPDKKQTYGELVIPSYGSGKVSTGQTVNIKIDSYPYDEYGMLKGVVESISQITNKIKTDKGVSDTYMVTVSFPKGLVTNYGKTLNLNFESTGTAEIITKPKRLIQRLFDNLKGNTEK